MTKKQYKTLVERVESAYHSGQALNICGASSKSFYGSLPRGLTLSVKDNQGIIDYDPAELVIVARAGTSLAEIQSTLAKKGQMLGFEPPFAEQGATLGGAVASGLAGACRPYRGGVRDYLLGTKIINGKGQLAQFGGQVMKNVAGFDLFRPMAGAMGTLGLLLEISLRVIPKPEQELSVEFALDNEADAIKVLCEFGKQLPSLSAASWFPGAIRLRLSGSRLAVNRDAALLQKSYATAKMDASYWQAINHFEHAWFKELDPQHSLVAIDLPPASPPVILAGQQMTDWGGARRYLKTPLGIERVRQVVEALGGNATLLLGGDRSAFFHPLKPGLAAVHSRLKKSFDPKEIFNPGRLYPGL
ncbi:MAG: glycolate oxidase subunit GlcE [Proteobacteria bacterium]|nr:glycolate oxidase subunit GlcE [Pseudomonadota bacterium]